MHCMVYHVIELYAIIITILFPAAVKLKKTTLAKENLAEIKDIEIQFAKMTNRIKRTLINNNVDVVLLIEQLCAISAVKSKKVPLFDEDVFEKIKSIDDFWKMLRSFLTIFSYELLLYVVKISECKEAQQILKEYLSKVDLSALEDVDLVLYCNKECQEGSLKPVLRIKVNIEECTPDVKKRVEEIVSKAYNLDKYALCFQGIKEGCIELLYYVSKSLRIYLLLQFKVSKSILEDFRAHKIISLHIDESELDTTVSNKNCSYNTISRYVAGK